jgi:hypothetical protein
MKTQEILDEILRILSTIKEDQGKLQEILSFLENEFCKLDEMSMITENTNRNEYFLIMRIPYGN